MRCPGVLSNLDCSEAYFFQAHLSVQREFVLKKRSSYALTLSTLVKLKFVMLHLLSKNAVFEPSHLTPTAVSDVSINDQVSTKFRTRIYPKIFNVIIRVIESESSNNVILAHVVLLKHLLCCRINVNFNALTTSLIPGFIGTFRRTRA